MFRSNVPNARGLSDPAQRTGWKNKWKLKAENQILNRLEKNEMYKEERKKIDTSGNNTKNTN